MTFQAWLEDPTAIRGVFVEAYVRKAGDLLDTPLYLSNIGLITKDSSVSFLPIITGGVKFSENISIGGEPTMSFGDIEINNPTGEYDTWLDVSQFVWVNKAIKIWVGDPRWLVTNIAELKSTFEPVFDGVIADIDSKSENTLNIKVRDKLERLNFPLTETKLGSTYGTWGGGRNSDDKILPICFGEVHNMEPMLIDPANLEYTFCNSSSRHLLEVRDNGVPIYTNDISSSGAFQLLSGISDGTLYMAGIGTISPASTISKFRLAHPLAGQITATVLGALGSYEFTGGVFNDTGYTNSIAGIVALIVTKYGKEGSRLSISDIDLANFSIFDTDIATNYPVGVLVTSTDNVLIVCNELANSVGAKIAVTRTGLLQLLRVTPYVSGAYTNIDSNDIIVGSFGMINRTTVTSSTKLNFCKNWTIQSTVAGSLPDEHKVMYSQEWYSTTVEDTNVKAEFGLSLEPTSYDTLLLRKVDADAEAARLNEMFTKPVTTYKFMLGAKSMDLKLGSYVFLTYRRFNLQNGVYAQITSLAPNWLSMTIDVEVTV